MMTGAPPAERVEYYVLRRGEMFGPFSEKELRSNLETERFAPTDFGQVDGQVHWRPLGRILGMPQDEMKGAIAPDWSCILKWSWLRLRYHFETHVEIVAGASLGLGALFLLLSRWPVVFWLPWFLLAVATAGILFLRERKVPAALVLVGVIVLPWLLLRHGARPVAETVTAMEESRSAPPATNAVSTASPVTTTSPAPVTSTPVVSSPAVTSPAVPAAPEPASTKVEPIPGLNEAPSASSTSTPAPAPASPSLLDRASKIADTVTSFFSSGKADASKSAPASGSSGDGTSAPAPSAVSQIQPMPANSKAPSTASIPPIPGLNSSTPGQSNTPTANAQNKEEEAPRFVPKNDAFVIIKGSNGSGSGFLCRQGDKTWLFSNIHVVSEVRQPVMTRLDGVAIVPTTAELAAGRDIARLTVPEPPHALEATTDFDNDVHINDDVVVLGNKGGGGVVTELKGKVLGIGPDRIEVSAEFIPGNSGSPIVHLKTGKVIGIATYLTRRYEEFSSNPQGGAKPQVVPQPQGGEGKGEVVVRRYGYRIDKVARWEPVNWAEMYAEADQVEQVSKLTEDIFDFLNALRTKKEPNFATDTLRRPATDWLSRVRAGHLSESDRRGATQGFLNTLRLMVRIDVANLDGRMRYQYFQNRLSEEEKVREELYKAFDSEFAEISSPESRHSFSKKH